MTDSERLLPLFIYGTLRNGQKNAWLLRGKIVAEIPATMSGMALYALREYPILLEDSSGGSVHGEMITLDAVRYDTIMAELDEFEGCKPGDDYLFRREARLVHIGESECVAWVYVGNPALLAVVPHKRILEGDWCRFMMKELN